MAARVKENLGHLTKVMTKMVPVKRLPNPEGDIVLRLGSI